MIFFKYFLILFCSVFYLSCTENLKIKVVDCSKVGKKCGTFYLALNNEPESLHPISSIDAYSRQVQAYVLDSLMVKDPQTYKWKFAVAKAYKKGPGLSYTFYLRKDVVFHDGTPLTAQDVAFSYKAIMNPAFKALALQSYFENIKSVKVLDPYTVRFNFKRKYFKNFDILAGLALVPKHYYKDPSKKLNKTILGSGPYFLKKYKKGQYIVLNRNKKWWGWKSKKSVFEDIYNFDRVFMRFISNDNLRFEMVKKQKVDFTWLSSELYEKRALGGPWGKVVFKKEVDNKVPKGYSFIGFNLKNHLFKSREIRLALAHLMNRRLINKKFLYNKSLLATGPWYKQSPYADPLLAPIEFNPKKAQKLLRKNGWSDFNKDGVLDKLINGTRVSFNFTLVFPNRDKEKYFTIYKQDLAKAGINMNLQVLEWSSFLKLLDSKKFEAVSLGWGGGGVRNDPNQIWHSNSARSGGSNFISYSNKKVDKLINQGRLIENDEKRKHIWKKVYRQIAYDVPYIFMFNKKFDQYAVSQKIKMTKPTYIYSVGKEYWWSF